MTSDKDVIELIENNKDNPVRILADKESDPHLIFMCLSSAFSLFSSLAFMRYAPSTFINVNPVLITVDVSEHLGINIHRNFSLNVNFFSEPGKAARFAKRDTLAANGRPLNASNSKDGLVHPVFRLLVWILKPFKISFGP